MREKNTFKRYLAELERENEVEVIFTEKEYSLLSELTPVLEHLQYKNIPGTTNSYRIDAANTNTVTQRHAHVYAKANGGGKQLYSVNVDGTGHDGSSGITIPKEHGHYFKKSGFDIPSSLVLESLDVGDVFEISGKYIVFTLVDSGKIQ